MNRMIRGSAVLLLVLLVVPGIAQAGPEARTLGEYRFPPSNQAPDPFVTTDFTTLVGGGMFVGQDFPILVVEADTLLALNGNLAFVKLGFQYQHAASAKVAVRFNGEVASRIGASGEALLAQGVSAITKLGMGTTVEIHRSERLLLSGVADVSYGGLLVVDLAGFLRDFVNEGLDAASLVQSDDGVVVSGGLRAGYALSRWIGATGAVEIGHQNTVYRERTGAMGAAAISFDFGQKGGLPVALSALLRLDSLSMQTANEGTHLGLGAGVAYSGREDFSLGLELFYSRIPIDDEDIALGGIGINLVSRYYF